MMLRLTNFKFTLFKVIIIRNHIRGIVVSHVKTEIRLTFRTRQVVLHNHMSITQVVLLKIG
jgi:hypothetical protein